MKSKVELLSILDALTFIHPRDRVALEEHLTSWYDRNVVDLTAKFAINYEMLKNGIDLEGYVNNTLADHLAEGIKTSSVISRNSHEEWPGNVVYTWKVKVLLP